VKLREVVDLLLQPHDLALKASARAVALVECGDARRAAQGLPLVRAQDAALVGRYRDREAGSQACQAPDGSMISRPWVPSRLWEQRCW
jgi:hypothetical protein